MWSKRPIVKDQPIVQSLAYCFYKANVSDNAVWSQSEIDRSTNFPVAYLFKNIG